MDGPSGAGKSSTARGAAEHLGLRYLDTGAQFRAMALWMLEHGVDVHDSASVAAAAGRPVLNSGTDPTKPTITLDGVDVASEIRSAEVTAVVSPVAAVPEVRARLLELQRMIIGSGGIVVEGRDIGSVVAPERAGEALSHRRPGGPGRAAYRGERRGSVDQTEAELLRRDAIDSGERPRRCRSPTGATHLDTTHLTLDDVIEPGRRDSREQRSLQRESS